MLKEVGGQRGATTPSEPSGDSGLHLWETRPCKLSPNERFLGPMSDRFLSSGDSSGHLPVEASEWPALPTVTVLQDTFATNHTLKPIAKAFPTLCFERC